MQIRAYLAVYSRAKKLTAKGKRGELLRVFQTRLAAAIAADPQEATPIEVPDEEWGAYADILNDRTGG